MKVFECYTTNLSLSIVVAAGMGRRSKQCQLSDYRVVVIEIFAESVCALIQRSVPRSTILQTCGFYMNANRNKRLGNLNSLSRQKNSIH